MGKKNTVRLPAVTIEVPRMGMVVYVSQRVGVQDNEWTCMFTAEIVSPEKGVPEGTVELQSFHLKCKSEKQAKTTIKVFTDRLKTAPFPFIQNKL